MTDVLQPWEVIEGLVAQGNPDKVTEFLATLSSAEIARAVSRLDDSQQAALLMLLEPEDAADLLEELSDTQGADLIEELEPDHAAAIIDEMDSGHRVDVLGEMEEDEAEAILDKMDPEEAEDARQLLTYPEDLAGGIMITEFLSYHMNLHVKDVLQDLRDNADMYSDYGVQYAYVINEHERLVGVIRLRDLILSKPEAPLTSVMIPNPLYVYVDSTLDELDEFFDRYAFVGVPVTDHNGVMAGVVRRGDAEEAYSERAEQSLMRFGGIIGGEEFRNMPVFPRASRRLAWLLINMGLSLCAASVILQFEDTIARKIALVFFIPVIANMSGCCGNQAVAVSIRELAMGLIQPQDYLRVWRKEMQVGLIIATVMGASLGAIAYLLHHNPFIGLLAGGALSMNIFVALTVGGLIPLFWKRLGFDPALAAPLVVTTFGDMCGFFLVLSMAALLISHGLI